MPFTVAGRSYELVRGTDVSQGARTLQVVDLESGEALATVLYFDDDARFEFVPRAPALPLALVEILVGNARDALAPLVPPRRSSSEEG